MAGLTIESTQTQKARAVQAVKVLRQFYDEVYHPHTRAKIKSLADRGRPKFLISVKHFNDRDSKVLEAIQDLQGEIEGIPE